MIFDLFGSYNFSTISNTVLKPDYKDMKVVGFGGFRQAIKYSGVMNDVVAVRKQLTVETGINLIDSNKAKYIFMEDKYGNEIVLAEDWINLDSVISIEAMDLSISIKNVTSDDTAIIVNTLKAMGYNNIELL